MKATPTTAPAPRTASLLGVATTSFRRARNATTVTPTTGTIAATTASKTGMVEMRDTARSSRSPLRLGLFGLALVACGGEAVHSGSSGDGEGSGGGEADVAPPFVDSVCGNRDVEPGEECDDGNEIPGDACRNDCTLPRCGDGIKDAGEPCDDGNRIEDDACSSRCTVAECGDRIVQDGEECD